MNIWKTYIITNNMENPFLSAILKEMFNHEQIVQSYDMVLFCSPEARQRLRKMALFCSPETLLRMRESLCDTSFETTMKTPALDVT